jgi:hypothetical protein
MVVVVLFEINRGRSSVFIGAIHERERERESERERFNDSNE